MQIELSTTRVHICRGSAILQIHKMDVNSSVYRYGVCPWSPRSHDGAQAVTSPSFRPFFSPGGEYVHPPLSMASRQTLMEVPQNAISDHIGNSFLSAPKGILDISSTQTVGNTSKDSLTLDGRWTKSLQISPDVNFHIPMGIQKAKDTLSRNVISDLCSGPTSNQGAVIHAPSSYEMALSNYRNHYVNCLPVNCMRARRGCATNPRSIAERLRRIRITERLRKLQALLPHPRLSTHNKDTAYMLDEIIDYIEYLQREVEILKARKCSCDVEDTFDDSQ
ncbi:hypothetical protein AXG93_4472s1100 [Marchantia polymorpha subsp. ruderalis]|uniref:BHLH domain-containing protein n=1 Tax=Marchantia polymorpha subsp. ruderalis TaxID=1480154 RepID=A0A176VK91_MARPO|nr:hypothetical protein AXG93_4472s1100 [Marchantia polymorpha subsp. ruderalis]